MTAICTICERVVENVDDEGLCQECFESRESMLVAMHDELCNKHDAMMADAEGAQDE